MRFRVIWLAGALALLIWASVGLHRAYSDRLLEGRIDTVTAMSVVLGIAVAFALLTTEVALSLVAPPPRTRLRLRLLVATLALSLVAAELGLRFGWGALATWQEENGNPYSSAYGHVLPDWVFVSEPNVSGIIRRPEFAYPFETNSEGLRDVDHLKSKPEDEYRILVLGDSFAEGAGAPSRDAWPKQLERRLNARYPERTIKTINAGVSGSDPWFEKVLLEKRLLGFEPDLVVVAVNSSDIFDFLSRGGEERFQRDGTVRFRSGPSWEWIYASSHFVRLICHVVLGYNQDLIRRDRWDDLVWQAADEMHASFLEFRALSREHHFELLAVLHPHAHDIIEGRDELERLNRRLRRETDIRVVDVLDYFVDEAGLTPENVWDYYWEQDRHHNAKGYALLARAVEEEIASWGLLEPGE